MLFFIMLLLWFLLNGKVSLQLLFIGILVCGGIYSFTKKYIEIQWAKKGVKRRIFELIKYIFILLREIVKSNIAVIKLVLTPVMEKWHPCFVCFDSDLKSERLRVILANSITLTPGTITVGLEEKIFTVHVLDHRLEDTIENGIFVQELKKIERGEKCERK